MEDGEDLKDVIRVYNFVLEDMNTIEESAEYQRRATVNMLPKSKGIASRTQDWIETACATDAESVFTASYNPDSSILIGQIRRHEVTLVHDDWHATVDIVLVHELHGYPRDT